MSCLAILALPVVLSTPGVYCLTSNLSTSESAITIAADHVTVDLQGHALEGTAGPSSTATGVYSSGYRGVTVKNGTISGFLYATRLMGGNGAAIKNVLFLGNWYIGAWAEGVGAEVSDSRVVNTGGSTLPGYTIPLGVKISGAGLTAVRNVVIGMIGGTEVVGIAVDDAPGGVVQGNSLSLSAYRADSYGLWVNGVNTRLLVKENSFANWAVGIQFSGAQGKSVGNEFQGLGANYVGGCERGILCR